MKTVYDVLVLGGGPIGAATAYFLSQKTKKRIGLITAEPTYNEFATYLNAGGSVRWSFWDNPKKVKISKETADFLRRLSRKGVDLSLHEDSYLFLNRGKNMPSVNISGAKLVAYFKSEAKAKGVLLHESEMVQNVATKADNIVVTTSKTEHHAKKVLLALGVQNVKFIPEYSPEIEKRYLMVLDLPVGEDESKFPHTIVPLSQGFAFVFIKKLPEGWRFLVGQEDVLEVPAPSQINAHFKALLATGLVQTMPFLKNAHVERVLTGTDVAHKMLQTKKVGHLLAANCGSAVRSIVPIGKELATVLLQK